MVTFRSLMKIAPFMLFLGATVCAGPLRVDRRLDVDLETESLDLEGVDIRNVEVDDLVTYFEEFDIDMLNALDDAADLPDVEIHASVQRLNQRPFGSAIRSLSAKSATMDESTKAHLGSQTGHLLPIMVRLCTTLSKPATHELRTALAGTDPDLNTFTTGISRLTGVSMANLAPEIAKDPSAMAKCFPETTRSIVGSSS
ncbi:hypothetical protein ACGC1H_001094 [Rhizoctonia solani]|uniref:Hemocyanin C-terminal domain-containing protein n=1 Tax=Rhizoctonia solani TaxID=456999 RepID=A0A8H3BDN1_9AGAM|nr:unnamed protein product [Rhizoctonia solani]